MNPDGSVYYYENTKGAWDGLVGPISNKQYTLASEANSKFSRNAEENGVLTRVHFDLRDAVAANHGPRAQVYMGAKSKALFVVFEARDFIDANPMQGGGRRRANSIMRNRTRTSSFGKSVTFD